MNGNFNNILTLLTLFVGIPILLFVLMLPTLLLWPKTRKINQKKEEEARLKREALEEKQAIKKIVKEEARRKEKEKYSMKELGGWVAAPWLLMLVLLLYIVYKAATETFDLSSDWYVFIPVGVIGTLLSLANEIEKEWKFRLEHKGPTEFEYDYENVYTDSQWNYVLYQAAKVVAVLISLASIAVAAIFIFARLGSVSIAPTTIIIILLLVIIHNQNKRDER